MTDVTGQPSTNAPTQEETANEAGRTQATPGETRAFETEGQTTEGQTTEGQTTEGQAQASTHRAGGRRPTAASTPQGAGGEDSVLVQGIETAQATADDLRVRFEDRLATASDYIRENPLTSVGVTFGAGLLLGMIMNRPRS